MDELERGDRHQAGTVLLQSASQTEHALAEALALGWSVRLKRLAQGFELALTPPAKGDEPRMHLAFTRGFSRRVGSQLLRSAQTAGARLWARPAGPEWPGWMEWGTLPAE